MTTPEDLALNFCMGYLGIYPYNTRDQLGREGFHPLRPHQMFDIDNQDAKGWMLPINGGFACCSTSSISFHNLKARRALHDVERMLYCCRDYNRVGYLVT